MPLLSVVQVTRLEPFMLIPARVRLSWLQRMGVTILWGRSNAAQWSIPATLPERGYLQWVATDGAGRPTALWARYTQDDRGEQPWLLLSHPLV